MSFSPQSTLDLVSSDESTKDYLKTKVDGLYVRPAVTDGTDPHPQLEGIFLDADGEEEGVVWPIETSDMSDGPTGNASGADIRIGDAAIFVDEVVHSFKIKSRIRGRKEEVDRSKVRGRSVEVVIRVDGEEDGDSGVKREESREKVLVAKMREDKEDKDCEEYEEEEEEGEEEKSVQKKTTSTRAKGKSKAVECVLEEGIDARNTPESDALGDWTWEVETVHTQPDDSNSDIVPNAAELVKRRPRNSRNSVSGASGHDDGGPSEIVLRVMRNDRGNTGRLVIDLKEKKLQWKLDGGQTEVYDDWGNNEDSRIYRFRSPQGWTYRLVNCQSETKKGSDNVEDTRFYFLLPNSSDCKHYEMPKDVSSMWPKWNERHAELNGQVWQQFECRLEELVGEGNLQEVDIKRKPSVKVRRRERGNKKEEQPGDR